MSDAPPGGSSLTAAIGAVHRLLLGLIKRLPVSWGILYLRAYNRLVRTIDATPTARTYFGARLFCNTSDLLQRMILSFGVWEPDVSKVVERSLQPGDVFVDIGANIGYDALLAAHLVGPSGRVVAIEALPQTFVLLRRNLELNAADNVRAVNVAVSNKNATVELYEVSPHNIGAVTTLAARGAKPLATVEAKPLAGILTSEEIPRLRLVKMDIEGGEPAVLHDILDHLDLYPPALEIIVEASPQDDQPAWRAIFERLGAAGFAAYEIDNSYEAAWYLKWRKPGALRRTDSVPARQQDLLLTRRKLAWND
ncbi:MAG: FkbM family methyltransferase [Reyranellaceae bacterium]